MTQYSSRHVVPVALAVFMLGSFHLGHSETLVASDVNTRLVLAFHVAETSLANWLPPGWELNPPASGPSRGANLIIGFVDRLLNLDPEAKPIAGGRDRYIALVVPAKKSTGTQAGNIVLRVYTGNAQLLPGAYKNSVLALVHRQQTDEGNDVEPGAATDSWEVQDNAGGFIQVKLQYRRGVLSRSTVEQKLFSPIQPDFFRIYRTDQGTDVIRSVPLGVDRAASFEFKVTIAELMAIFDGTQQLVSISAMPWGARQIFLP